MMRKHALRNGETSLKTWNCINLWITIQFQYKKRKVFERFKAILIQEIWWLMEDREIHFVSGRLPVELACMYLFALIST